MAAVVVVATITARDGQTDMVRSELMQILQPTREEAACELYELHISSVDPNRFVMIERWRDKASLDAHMQTPHFQKLAAAIGPHAKLDIAEMTKIG